jgi:methionyl-tRNA formyltransferase
MRAVIYSTVLPAIETLAELARSVGIEPVAVITPRSARDTDAAERRDAILTSAPDELDVCFAADRASLLRLTRAYEPDIGLCGGYSWLIPPEVIAVPRLGIVNTHPSLLPRHRGPFPFSWAVRENDPELGVTVHLMDEHFDTGPVLAQGTRPMPPGMTLESMIPTLRELNAELLPKALRRVLDGDRGDPQTEEGATYAGPFGEDYTDLDPERPRDELLRQVRAWQLLPRTPVPGPFVTVGGTRTQVLDAALEDPGDPDAVRLDAADGPLWLTVVEAEKRW